jgi:hypothetical protein
MTYWQQLFVRVAVLARRDLQFACAGMNLVRLAWGLDMYCR